ncbi:hypothetical protein F4692_001189 [Nocardioides cavernae]|uniref:Uncharacterized protein n=1 Tax=Nocardioides cavernae TaxID=1921566 RepID=A0A7Y9KQY6_9ACTN|nr:hypothetical protein [Nocardioides cavernae]NYE36085.1 hypothetical protein [Nocardioides cavernae]
MADTPEDRPSLEMPSFSLRRRRSSGAAPEVEEQAPEPAPEPVADAPLDVEERGTVGGLPAAVLTGVLVGGLALALAWLAGVACESVRGTSSCGGAAGLPILLATLAVMAYAGAVLLGLLGVREAGSTSLLAVGVLAVLVMVFLLGSLDETWALVAVPAASALAYAGAWWLTATVTAEDAPSPGPASRDVR